MDKYKTTKSRWLDFEKFQVLMMVLACITWLLIYRLVVFKEFPPQNTAQLIAYLFCMGIFIVPSLWFLEITLLFLLATISWRVYTVLSEAFAEVFTEEGRQRRTQRQQAYRESQRELAGATSRGAGGVWGRPHHGCHECGKWSNWIEASWEDPWGVEASASYGRDQVYVEGHHHSILLHKCRECGHEFCCRHTLPKDHDCLSLRKI